MTDNAWQAQLTGTFTRTSLLAALILRTPYVVISSDVFTDLDMQTAEVIIANGLVYLYDSADTTTAHDGVSCFVDTNGRRYKIVGSIPYPDSVLDRLATPPGSPNIGDTYLITAGATGAWAGQDDDLTTYTASGWLFITPKIGRPILVEDEDSFYFWDEAGTWQQGLGANSIAAGAVTPIEQDHIGIPTVIAILNTPPGAPTEGQRWLVGTSPTGAWVGSNNKLATWRSGAWVYTSPHNGAKLYDLTTAQEYEFAASAWTTTVVAPVDTEVIWEWDFSSDGDTRTHDVTGLSAYQVIEVDFIGLFSATGSSTMDVDMWLSNDDGSTFETAAASYNGPNANASLDIAAAAPINASRYYERVRITNMNVSTLQSLVTAVDRGLVGARTVSETNDALRITLTSGAFTISLGQIVVRGYRGAATL